MRVASCRMSLEYGRLKLLKYLKVETRRIWTCKIIEGLGTFTVLMAGIIAPTDFMRFTTPSDQKRSNLASHRHRELQSRIHQSRRSSKLQVPFANYKIEVGKVTPEYYWTNKNNFCSYKYLMRLGFLSGTPTRINASIVTYSQRIKKNRF